MLTDPSCGIEFLTVIARRKNKDELLNTLSAEGGRLINIVYGKGSVKSSYLMDILGLVADENKVVITCLIRSEKTDSVLDNLVKNFDFDKPNTGIAFTIPVENLSF